MRLDARQLGQTLVIRLEGELDLDSAAPFKLAVQSAFRRNPRLRNLVLVMDEVTFLDSSGVGAILGRYREVKERGGNVAAVGLQAPVQRVFAFCGMTRIIGVYESEGQALASL